MEKDILKKVADKLDKFQADIVLSEDQIEALINGEKIEKRFGDGVITIRQSYLKDTAAPIIRRPNKVVNTDHNIVLKKDIYLRRGTDEHYKD